MTNSQPARKAARRAGSGIALALVVGLATLGGVAIGRSPESPASSAALPPIPTAATAPASAQPSAPPSASPVMVSPSRAASPARPAASPDPVPPRRAAVAVPRSATLAPSAPPRRPARASSDQSRALGNRDVAAGAVPAGATVFDKQFPAVSRLDTDLLAALRRAARDAADDGVRFHVNSGWRSAAYQEQLLREAVAKYGSEDAAARWVATPDTSPHVSGDAIDIGPSAAAAWLSKHGATYGLCQIYKNEPWHYELRPGAVDDGCPPMYADPTRDPRMRK